MSTNAEQSGGYPDVQMAASFSIPPHFLGGAAEHVHPVLAFYRRGIYGEPGSPIAKRRAYEALRAEEEADA